MVFSSYAFILVFLPIVLAGFSVALRLGGRRWAMGFLVAASLAFYAAWSFGDDGHPIHLGLLLFSVGGNYLLGRLIEGQRSRRAAKAWLTLGVVMNLGLLAYFKYAGFFAEVVEQVAKVDWNLGNIVLPLAISFFTFQQIAYLVDVFRGKAKEHALLDYLLFVTFFPQFIAGPIVHHSEVLPQFQRRATFGLHPKNFSVGVTIFVVGLSKKVLIADELALIADPVFNGDDPLTFASAWTATLAYTLQIYFDFSGYSDMAIGLARMMGIRLPANFDSPYKSVNIIEFWRRWHITLSRFLRDYLYIPLGGNRRGKAMRYVNLGITMLLGGLWHGAGWTFVIWGGLHGFYLMVNHAFRAWNVNRQDAKSAKEDRPTRLGSAAGVLLTFLAVMIAWVFFRATNLEAAIAFLACMSGGAGFDGVAAPRDLLLIAGGLFVVWRLPNTQQLMWHARPVLGEKISPPNRALQRRLCWQPSVIRAIGLALLAVLCLMQMGRGTTFIYYQF